LEQVVNELRAAIAAGQDSFVLPAGDIEFADGSDFAIIGAQHMTISAAESGTTAWFAPPLGGLRLMNCQNVTFRGLTIDYNPLTYIQADIVAAPAAGRGGWRLQLINRSLHFAYNGSFGPLTQHWHWKGVGEQKWVAGQATMPTHEQVKPVAGQDGLYETCCGFTLPASAEVGDSLTSMLRQAHTVVVGNSSRVTLEDVTTLTTLGLNFYELDGDGGHVYRRIKVTRAPGYMIGSNADCFHSIDVGTGPTIIDSELGYCLDDFFNM
jgi:hypothetical protein